MTSSPSFLKGAIKFYKKTLKKPESLKTDFSKIFLKSLSTYTYLWISLQISLVKTHEIDLLDSEDNSINDSLMVFRLQLENLPHTKYTMLHINFIN